MKAQGVVIWAQSDCRSTMGLYASLAKQSAVPVVITLWHFRSKACDSDIRTQVGFRCDEFAATETIPVGENYEKGLKILDAHEGWMHLFCVWQVSSVYRKLIVEAKRRGCRVGIMCESPCNMSSGWRGLLKTIYMKVVLPLKARSVVRAADFFVNYSGDAKTAARSLGWPEKKIIPFGYYPPPIEGTTCVERQSNKPFIILATGVLARYRGADVLVKALKILKDRSVAYRAIITQEGELLPHLKEMAKKYGLPVEFPGFLQMPALTKLYETCSVYVGAGRSEPWGMRLNDALNCGAPLVVSRGMGGVKLIDDYECGLSFRAGDADDLAEKLLLLASDACVYRKLSANAARAHNRCAPEEKASELIKRIFV